MVKPQNIAKHELIGLDVKVVHADDKSLTGKAGVIIDETRNTLIIKGKTGTKKILKKGALFRLQIAGKTVEIEGKTLIGRPEERIKK
jgi:ribonuclease P protein subunit POP4